ncbi:MAG: sulfurtransferase [Anaerolineales bacterium]|nr:sulfurtransferase [Anaerolineales bacterium]
MLKPLISVEELGEQLANENLRIVDTRWYLADPTEGRAEYGRHHIPGAIFLDLDSDLCAPEGPGRHPLPDAHQFTELLGRKGIGNHHRVVVYDDSAGSVSARLWWMLKYLGHEAAAVLDGGFPEWKRLSLPVRTHRESRIPRQFKPRLNSDLKIAANEVLERISLDSSLIIDSRAPERYRGEEEPFDPIAGRIPGAVNRFWQLNLDGDGRVRDPDVLRAEFDSITSGIAPSDTIVHCGSGVTGCHNVLSMSYAGIQGVRLYAGSWSEWSSDPGRPIETGAQSG